MTFRFLRGAAGEQGLLDAHRPTIHRILRNDFTKKNMEKLSGHDVYSFRLGDAQRLLLSIILVNQKKYLLVLEYLPTHDYDKSRFLKSGVLTQYKEKMATSDKLQFEEIDNLDAFAELEFHEDEEEMAVDFYQDKWISLNTAQNDILHLKLPAVVNGAAGSGKSCVALSLLAVQVQESIHDEDMPKRFLYISQNPTLVRKMKEAWLALPAAVIQEEAAAAHAPVVEFKTFNDLLPPTIKIADEHIFSGWFKTKIQEKSKRKERDSIFLSLNETTLYEEFRICSGYTAEEYQHLGTRQSLIINHEERRELLVAFSAYKDHLSSLDLVDPSLHSFAFESAYSIVIVDETQDFSHAQITNLAKLTNNKQIICFMDSHQRLYDRLSIRPFLLNFLGIHKESPSHTQLSGSYRCPQRIMTVANEVIHFKHHLVQGIADKYEAKSISSQLLDSLGAIHLVDEASLFHAPWTREQSTQFAIITSEANRERAREVFQTPLVFTASEIKGLEYPIILAWELFDEAFFKRAFKRWVEVKDKKTVTGRSSEGEDESFISPLNAIFTAYTRAEQRLIICEKTTRENNMLLELLRPHHEDLPLTLEKIETTRTQWEDELRRQIRQGNEEQAHRIFTMKLAGLAKDYAAYVADFMSPKKTEPKPESPRPEPETPVVEAKKSIARSVAIAKPTTQVSEPEAVAKIQKSIEEFAALVRTLSAAKPKDKLQTCAELTRTYYNTRGVEFLLKNKETDIALILLNKYFKDDTHQTEQSLLEWILEDTLRTRTLIKESLHHVLLFLALNSVTTARDFPRDNEAFNKFLKFQRIFSQAYKSTLKNTLDNSILHHIIEHSKSVDADIFQYVEFGGDINLSINDFSATLLAVQNGRLDLIKILHKFGANIDLISSKYRISPLYLAAQKGNARMIRELYRLGANLDQLCTEHQLPPVFVAAQTGNIDTLNELHHLGANLNHTLPSGQNLGHFAVHFSQLAVLDFLDSCNVNLNQADHNGDTPLHIAAFNGNLKIIKMLRSFNVIDFNLHTKRKETAAYIAAQEGHHLILEELHSGGADLNITNDIGLTPVIIATIKNNIGVITELHRLGADFAICEKAGGAPIHIATELGNIELVRKFKEYGLDVNQKTNDGTAPIHLATAKRNIDMIEELHRLGANLNQVTKIGNAPIHIAAANNSIAVILKLHRLGANLNQTNGIGATAAHIAEEKGHKDALAAILRFAPQLDSPRFFKESTTTLHQENQSPAP